MSGIVSMFDSYAEERGFGPRIFFDQEAGFATYHLSKDECYIENIYVLPEKRNSKEASKIADHIAKIAKANGINLLTGSVSLKDKNKARNMLVLIAYGMTPEVASGELIYFSKEI